MTTHDMAAGEAARIVTQQTLRQAEPAPPLTALVPIAGNAEWWRGFLRGVASVRTVRAAWADEATEVGFLP